MPTAPATRAASRKGLRAGQGKMTMPGGYRLRGHLEGRPAERPGHGDLSQRRRLRGQLRRRPAAGAGAHALRRGQEYEGLWEAGQPVEAEDPALPAPAETPAGPAEPEAPAEDPHAGRLSRGIGAGDGPVDPVLTLLGAGAGVCPTRRAAGSGAQLETASKYMKPFRDHVENWRADKLHDAVAPTLSVAVPNPGVRPRRGRGDRGRPRAAGAVGRCPARARRDGSTVALLPKHGNVTARHAARRQTMSPSRTRRPPAQRSRRDRGRPGAAARGRWPLPGLGPGGTARPARFLRSVGQCHRATLHDAVAPTSGVAIPNPASARAEQRRDRGRPRSGRPGAVGRCPAQGSADGSTVALLPKRRVV